MRGEEVYLRDNDPNRIWQRYCGFLDFSVPEFMEVQEHLLLDSLATVVPSPLGQKILKGAKPKTLAEFRQQAPLTRYEDYAPHIGNCQEEMLAAKPACWAHTSGRAGSPKWVPYTEEAINCIARISIAILIMACASKKNEVRISSGVRLLQNLPARPYISGVGAWAMAKEANIRVIPPLETSEQMSFEKRIQTGFEMALRDGVDILGSMTTILVKMGERFTERSGGMKISRTMIHPRILFRVTRGVLKARREKRPLLPKDLWPLKGLIGYGMDTNIYRDKVKYYWGRDPLELYGATEPGLIAMQSWTRKWLTFLPFSCFLEFIPESELAKSIDNKGYQPVTVLLNELKPGERYEVVITSFYGMPMVRYRMGDLVRVVSLDDPETGIRLPQINFERRADDIIDVGGFTRLDEKTIWQAIVNTGFKHEDWIARKETLDSRPLVHIYIEPKGDQASPDLTERLHTQLRVLDKDYCNLEDMAGIKALKVTFLPQGSFQSYYEEMRRAGADLSHLKPPHMNAPDSAVKTLLKAASQRTEKS